MYYIGYDIGGTKCAVSLGEGSPEAMRIIAKESFETGGEPYDALDRMAQTADALLNREGLSFADVKSAGISCGGPLDSHKGIILSPPNLPGWDRIEASAFLEKKTGVKTLLQNDANACAVAEWRFGAGKGAQNMIFLTFGTGFGAGLILNGRLYSGANDMAGEVGHIRIAEDGPVGYNKRGSAEGFCSGGGIARLCAMRISESLKNGVTPEIYKAVGGDMDRITAKLIAERAFNGDEFCKGIYNECGRKLGLTLSILMDIINPELIVIGGVFMRSEELLRPAMEKVINDEALSYSNQACRIVKAGLGESIGDYAALGVATL